MRDELPTVHMVVKNEDRFIWYALSSVLPFADTVLITDTGSTDKTVSIINSIHSSKIKFEQKQISHASDVSRVRQKQIDETTGEWIWIVDGDEVYPRKLCEEIVDVINKRGGRLEGIVIKRIELLGDIYHRQDESVGAYELFGKKGHFAIRLLNKRTIPRLHIEGIYPLEGYYDGNGVEVIGKKANRYYWSKENLFHCVYLKRSTQGGKLQDTFNRNKYKIEKGEPLPQGAIIPEVFFAKHPPFVPTVTNRRSRIFELIASLITPVRQFKRRVFP